MMNARTLKALRGSIEKWEAIVAGTGEDQGIVNCPLCALFYRDGCSACSGCPVAKAAGREGCEGTPYIAWTHAEDNGTIRLDSGRVSARLKRLAQAELDFLKGLLPKRKPRAKA